MNYWTEHLQRHITAYGLPPPGMEPRFGGAGDGVAKQCLDALLSRYKQGSRRQCYREHRWACLYTHHVHDICHDPLEVTPETVLHRLRGVDKILDTYITPLLLLFRSCFIPQDLC